MASSFYLVSMLILSFYGGIVAQSQPYCFYEIIGEQSRATLRSFLNFTISPTPFQRSYAAFMLAVHKTGEQVAKGVDYDIAYDSAVDLVTMGNLLPGYARDYNLNLISEVDEQVIPMKDLIHQILKKKDSDIKNEDLESCDRQVNSIVHCNPSCERPAKLVVEEGKICVIVNSMSKELDDVIKNQKEKQYVANGRNHLKPLILQGSAIIKILRNL